MKTLNDIRIDTSERLLKMRSLHRLVSTLDFQLAYEIADSDEIDQVLKWIVETNIDDLRTWIRERNKDEPSIRELKKKASRLNIKHYSRMNKASLLSAIHHKENNVSST